MAIIWKPLPQLPDAYEICNNGRVRSLRTKNDITLRNNGKEAHLYFDMCHQKEDGTWGNSTLYIHKVVAEIFLPRPSDKHVHVRHIDGNRENNHVDNLKWITASELAAENCNLEKSWQTRRELYGKNGFKDK